MLIYCIFRSYTPLCLQSKESWLIFLCNWIFIDKCFNYCSFGMKSATFFSVSSYVCFWCCVASIIGKTFTGTEAIFVREVVFTVMSFLGFNVNYIIVFEAKQSHSFPPLSVNISFGLSLKKYFLVLALAPNFYSNLKCTAYVTLFFKGCIE